MRSTGEKINIVCDMYDCTHTFCSDVGVPLNKLVIGKPAQPSDGEAQGHGVEPTLSHASHFSASDGYIRDNRFNDCLKQAVPNGWRAGAAWWQAVSGGRSKPHWPVLESPYHIHSLTCHPHASGSFGGAFSDHLDGRGATTTPNHTPPLYRSAAA